MNPKAESSEVETFNNYFPYYPKNYLKKQQDRNSWLNASKDCLMI